MRNDFDFDAALSALQDSQNLTVTWRPDARINYQRH